jgi:hypothetical protein
MMMRSTRRLMHGLWRAHHGDSGIVLIQVIAFSIVLAMITFALVNLSISEYATANSADQGMRAFYIADAAVERAITVLRADSNWNDGTGADKNANNTSWQPLYDAFQAGGAGNAVNQTYPAGGGSGSGTYSVYIKRVAPGSPYNAADTIWIRTLGTSGSSTRSIEILLHRLTPLDFSVYSAQTFQVSNGGGNVTLHGSAYFYQDLGLKAVQTGIYNDRQIQSADLPPYTNQLYVKGTLDMSKGNSTVGTLSQPMYGVHAGALNLKSNGTQNLHTLELDNIVPSIPYPNVAGYITSVLTNQTYGNLLAVGQLTMAICTNTGGVWTQSYTPGLTFGATEFTIPAKGYTVCDNNATNSANYMAHWNPSATVPLTLNSSYQNSPILVPGAVVINQSVNYSGVGTFVVETLGGGSGIAINTGQILSSYPASNSSGSNPCGYANPSSMPQSDLLAFIVAGNVALTGSGNTCSQENDVVIIAGANGSSTFTSTNKVNMYGVLITEQLDTTQNPDFYQIPSILQYMPGPVQMVATFNTTMPVVVWQWRELTN